MELKEQFINAVVRNMEPELEASQRKKLKTEEVEELKQYIAKQGESN